MSCVITFSRTFIASLKPFLKDLIRGSEWRLQKSSNIKFIKNFLSMLRCILTISKIFLFDRRMLWLRKGKSHQEFSLCSKARHMQVMQVGSIITSHSQKSHSLERPIFSLASRHHIQSSLIQRMMGLLVISLKGKSFLRFANNTQLLTTYWWRKASNGERSFASLSFRSLKPILTMRVMS